MRAWRGSDGGWVAREIWCAHHGRKTRCAAASSCAFHAVIRGWLMNGCSEEDPQSSPPQSWSCEHTSPGISQHSDG